MSNPVVRKLILKELSLNRMFIAIAVFAGLASIGISFAGRMAFAVGAITFLTVIIAYGVLVPMFSIVAERKEKSLLFVLSLPVSGAEYVRAKMIGVVVTFLLPWSLLLVAVAAFILATPVPDGMLPYTVLIMGFALSNFCVIVCSAMMTRSEAVMIAVIILTNMSVTFFMTGISSLTPIGAAARVDAVVWGAHALAILGCEAAVIAAAFAIFFRISGREPQLV